MTTIHEYILEKGLLGDVLGADQWLVMVRVRHRATLSLLEQHADDTRARMVAQTIITEADLPMIEVLLSNHPDFTPYEQLLSVFTSTPVDDARDQLLEAIEDGTWDVVMRPVRNVLSRCRASLHPLGIEISSLHETGYTLARYGLARRLIANGEKEVSHDRN